ncbi:SigE family RNA polymerase sigma factor [Solihabitans fulvus]|uniref:SigE family RNA polymerase sigma factor n=1 Tax=Solihabitans fulvus TaxID=1892852 RepID=A0A5B2XCZ5_9PSEU|nr:SigE family RNA polymerase sigma factor [Solihabitans fulvus]KAA2260911.1 SigE family RNA polymerase sigma factor [Solihabitans fulvus]
MTFEEFAQTRLPALLRYAVALTGERGLAEDVVQEVLVRVHARWRSVESLDQPDAYVRRMVVNEYLSWRRRWARFVPSASVSPPEPDTPDHATRHADRDALRAELGRLPARQRAVLVLRYYEGLTDPEIAEVLGCGASTVRGYATRALATLRVDPRTRDLVTEDR